MDRELLDKFVLDKNLFKQALKECTTNKDLYNFLKLVNCGGYKIYVDNRWSIPVEDITIYEDGNIYCSFYMTGHRTYKSVKGFIRAAELITCDPYDNFTLTLYKK